MSYDRPTRADVERALTSYVETIDRAGELGLRLKRDGARLVLEQGGGSYGRAWRLYETGHIVTTDTWPEGAPTTGYYNPIVGSDYLGMTAREAHDAITTRHRVVADVLGAVRDVTREDATYVVTAGAGSYLYIDGPGGYRLGVPMTASEADKAEAWETLAAKVRETREGGAK